MRRQRHSDAGSVTIFILLLTISLMALLGLVADGGAVLSAREAATAEAEQAARAGAAVLSATTLRDGGITTGGAQAVGTAEYFMSLNGHPGVATDAAGTVTARVTPFTVSTGLLGLVGIPSMTVTAVASAKAVDG